MQNASHTIREELFYILLFLGAIWAVFGLSCVFESLNAYGVAPRTASGLIGIPISNFLHENFRHVFGNTIPLFILLALLAGSKARSWEIVLYIVLLGGSLLWVFGRSAVNGHPTVHIGASGLIFGLIAFLILSGFLEKRLVPLLIAIAVCFFYGGTLLSGVMPQVNSNVSWDGHLCGAIAGGLVAYYLTKESRPEKNSLETDGPIA
jgi:membrane associated rhomboid family serine protease